MNDRKDNQVQLKAALTDVDQAWYSLVESAVSQAPAPQRIRFADVVDRVLYVLLDSCCELDMHTGFTNWSERPIAVVIKGLAQHLASEKRGSLGGLSDKDILSYLSKDMDDMYKTKVQLGQRSYTSYASVHPEYFAFQLSQISVRSIVYETALYRRDGRGLVMGSGSRSASAGFGEITVLSWETLLARHDEVESHVRDRGTSAGRDAMMTSLLALTAEQKVHENNKLAFLHKFKLSMQVSAETARFSAEVRLQQEWERLVDGVCDIKLGVVRVAQERIANILLVNLRDEYETHASVKVKTQYARWATIIFNGMKHEAKLHRNDLQGARTAVKRAVEQFIHDNCDDGDLRRNAATDLNVDVRDLTALARLNGRYSTLLIRKEVLPCLCARFEATTVIAEAIQRLRQVEPTVFLRSTTNGRRIHSFDAQLQAMEEQLLRVHSQIHREHDDVHKTRARVEQARTKWYKGAKILDALSALKAALRNVLQDVDRVGAGRDALSLAQFFEQAAQHLQLDKHNVLDVVLDTPRLASLRDVEIKHVREHDSTTAFETARESFTEQVESIAHNIETGVREFAKQLIVVAPRDAPPPDEEQPAPPDSILAYGAQRHERKRPNRQMGQEAAEWAIDTAQLHPDDDVMQAFRATITRLVRKPALDALSVAPLIDRIRDQGLAPAVMHPDWANDYNAVAEIRNIDTPSVRHIERVLLPFQYSSCVSLLYFIRYQRALQFEVEYAEWFNTLRRQGQINNNEDTAAAAAE